MFSSLPSASKIYVNSCKPKQKNLNSAKKRRKKVATITSTPVHIQDEETLVSSSSLRKNSSSQISTNSHEESLEVELATMSEGNDMSVFSQNDNVRSRSFESNCFENKCKSNVDVDNASKATPDDLYCDLNINNNNTLIMQDKDQEVRNENLGDNLDVSVEEEIKLQTEESDKIVCDGKNSAGNEVSALECTAISENETSIPLKQYEDSSMQTGEDSQEIFTDASVTISTEETINEYDHPVFAVDSESQTGQCNENQELFPSSEVALNFEKEEIFAENSDISLKKYRNSLGEDILKQSSDSADSSSVKSDCCMATNIYDVHIDNSEQSSGDENEISHDLNGRMQSPEQSEVSCTESFICDAKNICQNKSVSENYSSFERDINKKQTVTISSLESYSESNTLCKNLLDNSQCLTDMQDIKSYEILSRSASLPENISKFKYATQLSNHVVPREEISYDNASQVPKVMLDKHTSTSESTLFNSENSIFSSVSTVATLEKSTNTLESVSQSSSRKDMVTSPIKILNEVFVTKNKSISTSFKDSSMHLMKVLPPVAVMQARARYVCICTCIVNYYIVNN